MDSQVVENKLDKKWPAVQTPRSHARLKPILCLGNGSGVTAGVDIPGKQSTW